MQHNKNQLDFIKDYINGVLVPLDKFYSSHYKELTRNPHEKSSKLLNQSYDLFLQKLEYLSLLIETQTKKK